MTTYIRGTHNAMTPFHKWHTVKSEDAYIYHTNCGLPFHKINARPELANKVGGGDKCDTLACGINVWRSNHV